MIEYTKGVDLSTLYELEKLGARYFDKGEEKDILEIMKAYDIDTVRLRLWNDPYSPSGEPYGAGTNDLETTLAIGKKVTEAGLGVLLNFHYSDFWADPGKQYKPKAWEQMNVQELEDAVYDFTFTAIKYLQDKGVRITMIQIGNELSNGLLWPEGKVPEYEN
ncbi:MAG TPA: glycosyl hydrolase, partial [Lachnospiraceae bacterium]|nr:glycosyl hydrolase [Lachnospiraceae bacterium]